MIKIIADHRERNSGIIKELIKQKIDVEQKQLTVGDFIIQTKTSDNRIIDLGIERKTKHDFINSIIDKRMLSQLSSLKQFFPLQVLIIEGKENIYTIRNFHPNAIRGMLASIAIDYQIPILYTLNYRDTASLLSVMAKRLERPFREMPLQSKRRTMSLKQKQELLIESLPGIGPSLSKALLKRFKTIKRIINDS